MLWQMPTKVVASIKSHGPRNTFIVILMRLKAILELPRPVTIWGDRIGLRPVKDTLADAEVERVYRWRRDEQILRWSGGTPTDFTLGEFRDHLRRERWRAEPNHRVFYIVTLTGELIGHVGLFTIDWAKSEGEFGIVIGEPEYWGKGYGRDATQMLIRYIFTQTPLNRIYLGTFKDNLRAQRCFAACGFRVVGITSQYDPVAGEYIDGPEMEITRSDFQGQ
jgi:RimJ/RimL family protein N-acetyltransferase